MGLPIEDGKGKGNVAHVNDDNQLVVRAITQPDVEFYSEIKGDAYTWNSSYSATGGQEVISLKNTSSSKDLIIEEIIVGSTVNQVWTLFEVTSGTAAGTTITGQNLNLGSGNVASQTAFGNASVTGSLTGNNILFAQSLANEGKILDLKGALILKLGDEIALTANTTGTVYVTIVGFYVDPSEL
jgi:hypothetical protein